jgi:hypothetical protein
MEKESNDALGEFSGVDALVLCEEYQVDLDVVYNVCVLQRGQTVYIKFPGMDIQQGRILIRKKHAHVAFIDTQGTTHVERTPLALVNFLSSQFGIPLEKLSPDEEDRRAWDMIYLTEQLDGSLEEKRQQVFEKIRLEKKLLYKLHEDPRIHAVDLERDELTQKICYEAHVDSQYSLEQVMKEIPLLSHPLVLVKSSKPDVWFDQ